MLLGSSSRALHMGHVSLSRACSMQSTLRWILKGRPNIVSHAPILPDIVYKRNATPVVKSLFHLMFLFVYRVHAHVPISRSGRARLSHVRRLNGERENLRTEVTRPSSLLNIDAENMVPGLVRSGGDARLWSFDRPTQPVRGWAL